MKKILITVLLIFPLIITTPTPSQIRVQVGNPTARPWPDGVWVPGHYVYRHDTGRRVWTSGNWHHDNGHHYGWYKGKGRGKHEDNYDNGNGRRKHEDGYDNGNGRMKHEGGNDNSKGRGHNKEK